MSSISHFKPILLALLALTPVSMAVAEPRVSHLEPAGVQRGTSCRLEVSGSGLDRPVDVWTSLPAGKFKVVSANAPGGDRAELLVDVAADCPLGLYGLRLATEDGLSNCLLFLVDDLPIRPVSPDQRVTLPVAIAGHFRVGEVDRYSFQTEAGERIAFEAVASRLGTDADPLITIFDSDGKRLARRDNDPGLFFDNRFDHVFERAGIYTVEIRDSRYLGALDWRYVLRMGKFPAAKVALPSVVPPGQSSLLKFPEVAGAESKIELPVTSTAGVVFHGVRRESDNGSAWVPITASKFPSVVEQEPNNTIETATLLPGVPCFAEGCLEQPGDRDLFAFELKKGDKLFLKSTTRQLQSSADVELVVLDATGKELQRADDVVLPGGALEEAALSFNAGQDGKFHILVRDITGGSGPDCTYRVELQPALPRFLITTDIAGAALPAGSYQSLPLSVTRTDFDGEIELSLVDAPAGVRLEPTTIPTKENQVLCKLIAGDVPPGLHSLRITAHAKAGETPIEGAVVFQPMIDKQLINQDLQKTALRENQRWLPASIQTRFALQITPAIPFEIEPAETSVVLPRYHQSALKIHTRQTRPFEGTTTFTASGGQLGEEAQGRRQVFGRFPVAGANDEFITATFHSRSQAQELTERVDIVSQTRVGNRKVTLLRSIQLQVKPSFEIEVVPSQITAQPGEKVTVKLVAHRLPSFDGEIRVELNTNMKLPLPETVTIPASGTAEFDIMVPADFQPRRDRIRFIATGVINGFQEEPRPKELDLEVKMPDNGGKK